MDGFAQAFADWRAQFEQRPLWRPLRMSGFEAKHTAGLEQSDVLGGDIMVQVGQAEVLAPLAAVPSVPQLLQQVGESACAVLRSRSLWRDELSFFWRHVTSDIK